jgi:hypothetical protein
MVRPIKRDSNLLLITPIRTKKFKSATALAISGTISGDKKITVSTFLPMNLTRASGNAHNVPITTAINVTDSPNKRETVNPSLKSERDSKN